VRVFNRREKPEEKPQKAQRSVEFDASSVYLCFFLWLFSAVKKN